MTSHAYGIRTPPEPHGPTHRDGRTVLGVGFIVPSVDGSPRPTASDRVNMNVTRNRSNG